MPISIQCFVLLQDREHHQLTVMAQDRGEKHAYASGQADTASVQINIKEVRNNLSYVFSSTVHLPTKIIEQVSF